MSCLLQAQRCHTGGLKSAVAEGLLLRTVANATDWDLIYCLAHCLDWGLHWKLHPTCSCYILNSTTMSRKYSSHMGNSYLKQQRSRWHRDKGMKSQFAPTWKYKLKSKEGVWAEYWFYFWNYMRTPLTEDVILPFKCYCYFYWYDTQFFFRFWYLNGQNDSDVRAKLNEVLVSLTQRYKAEGEFDGRSPIRINDDCIGRIVVCDATLLTQSGWFTTRGRLWIWGFDKNKNTFCKHQVAIRNLS